MKIPRRGKKLISGGEGGRQIPYKPAPLDTLKTSHYKKKSSLLHNFL